MAEPVPESHEPKAIPEVSQDDRISAQQANTTARTDAKMSIDTDETRQSEFEVYFGENDPMNPQDWPFWYRSWSLFCIAFSSLVVSLYSTIYTSSIPGLEKEFDISNTIIPTLGVTTYLIGIGLGSVVQAPLSEVLGRRPIYLISMSIFSVLIIPCSLATSIAEILVVRFFGSVLSSVILMHDGRS